MTKAHEFFEEALMLARALLAATLGVRCKTDAEARRVDIEVRSGIAKFSAARSG